MATATAARATETGLAQRYLEESRMALEACAGNAEFVALLERIADLVADALKRQRKILFCGNGGSAADAQHLAGELLSRFEIDRAPLPALALTADSAVMTAIGNDYGYDQVFERQVRGLGVAGDVIVGLSTSGRSANVLKALAAARAMGLTSIGFTGADGGSMQTSCDLLLRAPSTRTPIIQQVHMTAGHIICELVERRLGRGSQM